MVQKLHIFTFSRCIYDLIGIYNALVLELFKLIFYSNHVNLFSITLFHDDEPLLNSIYSFDMFKLVTWFIVRN
jgi:hypothetical protein